MPGATAPRFCEVPRSEGRFLAGRTYCGGDPALAVPPWKDVSVAGSRCSEAPLRRGGRRCSRRDVVVGAMAVDAGHAAIGMLRSSPARPFGTGVLLVALQARFGPCYRVSRLETEDQSGLPALSLQVAAGRAMTAFTTVTAVHVVGKRLGVCLVALGAQLVVIDIFRSGNRRHRAFDFLVTNLRVEVVRTWPPRGQIRLGTTVRLLRRPARYRQGHEQARAQNR